MAHCTALLWLATGRHSVHAMQRAEHNDGVLATLEEVSLHQLNIEKIEGLGQLCKHLRILYLQSNLISKLENIHKLKVSTRYFRQRY